MNNPQSNKRDRVAEIIRWLMFDRNEDISQLADHLGYSVTVISEAERAMLPISNKLLLAILSAHPRINPHWIETGEGEMLTISDESDARQYLARSTNAERHNLAMRLASIEGKGKDAQHNYLSNLEAVHTMLLVDDTLTSLTIEAVISGVRTALQYRRRI